MKRQHIFPLGNKSEGEGKQSLDQCVQKNKLVAAQWCPQGWVKVSGET